MEAHMTPIKTPAGEILALRLPSSSEGFTIYTEERTGRQYVMYVCLDKDGLPDAEQTELLPEGNWEILGPISHKGEFGFDPNLFVRAGQANYNDTDAWTEFWDYKYETWHRISVDVNNEKEGAEQSFISLIEAQGEILWSNPMGDKNPYQAGEGQGNCRYVSYGDYCDPQHCVCSQSAKWQFNESKLVKEKEQVIIFKKVNR